MPIDAPPGFSATVADGIGGPFETLGWAVSGNALKDSADTGFGPQSFLDHAASLLEQRERILTWGLSDALAWDVYMQVFTAPDRVGHMFAPETDAAHPAYDADEADTLVSAFGREIRLAEAVDETYRQVDRIVGDVLDRVQAGEFGADALLLVLSGHGMASWRRGVNLNTFPYEHGYLATKDDVAPADLNSREFSYVDWENTWAYALGLGQIYVNLAGREPKGRVQRAEVPALLAAISADLLALTDGESGPSVVSSVSLRDEAFTGPWVEADEHLVYRFAGTEVPADWAGFAELNVGFAPGYRVAGSSTLGGITESMIDDNESRWTGDHASVDPAAVRGLLLANRPLDGAETPSILDIAPTLLSRYGLDPAATDMDGSVLPIAELRK